MDQFLENFRNADQVTVSTMNQDDPKIIQALAEQNAIKGFDTSQYSTWFGLYTLQHRASYGGKRTTPTTDSYCILKNSDFDQILESNLSLEQYSLSQLKSKENFPKYLELESGTIVDNAKYEFQNNSGTQNFILVNEKDGLGTFSFSANIRNGAALNGSFTNGVIPYNGYYSYWESGGRTIYLQHSIEIGNMNSSDEEYVLYTRGGAPLNSNNWIIAYIERGVGHSSIDLDIYKKDASVRNQVALYASSMEINEMTQKVNANFNLKLYINLFMPNGCLVRTELNRSKTYFNNGRGADSFQYWVYTDQRNSAAASAGYTFKNVWNSIWNKEYRQFGPVRNRLFNPVKNKKELYIYNWNTGFIGEKAKKTCINSEYISDPNNWYPSADPDPWDGKRRR